LNVPRRPEEASGTSGMKAAVNGVLNASTLDGWWAEAWAAQGGQSVPIGWAVGRGEQYEDPEYQDQVEAEALFDVLERDIVPTFYDRGPDGLPRQWIAAMKASIGTLCTEFNTHRMVRQYTERFYLPMTARAGRLGEASMAGARRLAAWRKRVEAAWPRVTVQSVTTDGLGPLTVGDAVRTRAHVQLGGLAPEDVAVQLYVGRVDARGELADTEAIPMVLVEGGSDGQHVFEATAAVYRRSGLNGFTVRVLPAHADLQAPFLPGLIAWSQADAAR
jgi:starch phosphorylase